MIGEENIVQLIGNFGFPIVVTIYLLHRFENKIDSLENTIHNIANVVNNSIEKRKWTCNKKDWVPVDNID